MTHATCFSISSDTPSRHMGFLGFPSGIIIQRRLACPLGKDDMHKSRRVKIHMGFLPEPLPKGGDEEAARSEAEGSGRILTMLHPAARRMLVTSISLHSYPHPLPCITLIAMPVPRTRHDTAPWLQCDGSSEPRLAAVSCNHFYEGLDIV